MAFSKEPLFIVAFFNDVLKKCMDFQPLLHIHAETIFQRSWRLVGDDIIHSCLIAVQVANGSSNLVMGRLFLPPPIACIPAVFIVLTVTAAKGKIFLVLNGVNFPTLQVKNIRGNQFPFIRLTPAGADTAAANQSFRDSHPQKQWYISFR